jgi:ribosomal protein S6--L-glutamate ligase
MALSVALLLERHPARRDGSIMPEVARLLTHRGARVERISPEDAVTDLTALEPTHDLYVLKSGTDTALSVAGALDAAGAAILNPYAVAAACRDKIVQTQVLRRAGVPVPRSWVTGDLALLEGLLEETPLIVKPHRGHRGAGIAIVRNGAELGSIGSTGTPAIVQEYFEGSGEDLKVYVVGEEVFAVRKPFSEASFTVPGRPVAVTRELRRVALACGRILGLGLYGIDLVEAAGGPVVVDVNYFPGYKGVPDVAPLIADYIADYATGSVTLSLPELEAHPREAVAHPGGPAR